MLKIIEVKSEEHFETIRQKEEVHNDYLYICKYDNLIKISDNGELRTFGSKVENVLAAKSKAYITGTPAPNTKSNTPESIVSKQVFDKKVYLGENEGELVAEVFVGNLKGKLTTPYSIDGIEFDGSYDVSRYCICSTDGAVANKTVSLSNFKLTTGAIIKVKFDTANSASNPTLNVNNSGAKPIVYQGYPIEPSRLKDNVIYEFLYNGTQWELITNVQNTTATVVGTKLILNATVIDKTLII